MAMSAKKIMVLIAGNAGMGKDTLGRLLCEIFGRWTSVRHDYFAYSLKMFAHEAFGTPWHLLNADKDVKESTSLQIAGDEIDVTVREGLQYIGHFFRERFDKRVWANSVLVRAKRAQERITVVTDCRHPNEEVHWIKEAAQEFADVYHVRIHNDSVSITRGHPSEDEIADAPDDLFDIIVDNNGTLEQLEQAALEIASAVVLMHKTSKRHVPRAAYWAEKDEDLGRLEPLCLKSEIDALVAFGDGYTSRKVTYSRIGGKSID